MATPPTPNDLTRQQLDELDALLQRMLALPLNKGEGVTPFRSPPPLPDLPAVPADPLVGGQRPPSPLPPDGWRADEPAPAKTPYLAPEPATLPMPVFRSFDPPAPATAPSPRLYAPPTPSPAVEYAPPAGGPGTLRGVDAPALPFGYEAPPPEPTGAAAQSEGLRGVATPSSDPWYGGMNLAEVNPFAELAPAAAELPPPRPAGVPVLLWPLFAVNWVLEFVLGWFGPLGHLLTRPAMKAVLGWVGVLLLVAAGGWAAKGMGWVSWPR